jgi:membrane dipeptidase
MGGMVASEIEYAVTDIWMSYMGGREVAPQMKFGAPIANTYGGPNWGDVHYRRARLGERAVFTRTHLPDLRKGGVSVIVQPVSSYSGMEELLAEVDESQGQLTVATNMKEMESGISRGQLVFVICAGYQCVDQDSSVLPFWHHIGARVFSLSHNRRNLLADGCGERGHGGLSNLGIEVVHALERLGIIVDVSHLSETSFWDVVKHTSKPFIATHSNVRALCETPRNLTDDQIRALAERGGLMGLNYFPGFIREKDPTVLDIADHIDYVASMVGPEHVALGPDFTDKVADVIDILTAQTDPTGTIYHEAAGWRHPKGAESAANLSDIGDILLDRGWSREDVGKVVGDNFLRVFAAVCEKP